MQVIPPSGGASLGQQPSLVPFATFHGFTKGSVPPRKALSLKERKAVSVARRAANSTRRLAAAEADAADALLGGLFNGEPDNASVHPALGAVTNDNDDGGDDDVEDGADYYGTDADYASGFTAANFPAIAGGGSFLGSHNGGGFVSAASFPNLLQLYGP
jgi:hypothetical protein